MKKKTKQVVTKEREDECFSCGDGGQIVSCKKPGCPKVYHADCLNLAKRPAGKYRWTAGAACVGVALRPCYATKSSYAQECVTSKLIACRALKAQCSPAACDVSLICSHN